jgi:hypothetical protein
MVRLLLAKECELQFFRRHCEGFFVGEKNWNWSFALGFCFFFAKQKENKK